MLISAFGRSFGFRRLDLVSAIALGVIWPNQSAFAQTIGFSLGDFSNYGILVNNGVSGGDINTAPVNASVGIGNTTGPINFHNEVVNGNIDVSGSSSTIVSGGNISGWAPAAGGGSTPSQLNSNVQAVESAIQTATSLSSHFGNEAPTGTLLAINGGSMIIDAASGAVDAAGVHVFTTTNFQVGNGNALTIRGSANDYVVINVTGAQDTKLDGAVRLVGGLTSDHVIINFTGTGGALQGAANGALLDGVYLAPNMRIQLNSLNIEGRIFGGAAGTNFQFVSNAFIDQPGWPPATGGSSSGSSGGVSTSVPEPGVVALFAICIALIGYRYRKRSIAFGGGSKP